MDEFLREINCMIFYRWVYFQLKDDYQIQEEWYKGDLTLMMETQTSRSEITFYQQNIVEFRIINLLNDEVIFYLHFQMNAFSHAVELFHEMKESMAEASNKSALKILLCCSGGMTSGFFAEKLQTASDSQNLRFQVSATGYQRLYQQGQDYDIILLAPQISYAYSQVKNILNDKIVIKIPPKIFAKYDVAGMIDMISKAERETQIEKQPEQLKISKHINDGILCLAIVRNSIRTHVFYRYYENNQIVIENEVIKNTLDIADLYDIIDTVSVRYSKLQIIGISTPGIINNGFLTSFRIQGLENNNIVHLLKERYHKEIIFSNDVNCAALGFYEAFPIYNSVSFLFQPIHSYSGIGSIVNGRLVTGRKNIAGESQFLPMNLSADFVELTTSPEGALEVVAKTLLSAIAIISPDILVVVCQMIPDVSILKRELEKMIDKEYIPEIVKVVDMQKYIHFGILNQCIEVLQTKEKQNKD